MALSSVSASVSPGIDSWRRQTRSRNATAVGRQGHVTQRGEVRRLQAGDASRPQVQPATRFKARRQDEPGVRSEQTPERACQVRRAPAGRSARRPPRQRAEREVHEVRRAPGAPSSSSSHSVTHALPRVSASGTLRQMRHEQPAGSPSSSSKRAVSEAAAARQHEPRNRPAHGCGHARRSAPSSVDGHAARAVRRRRSPPAMCSRPERGRARADRSA